jgi:hypothetical protein
MQLDFAMLALNADHSANGKLHIFGGAFDLIQVSELPATVPPFNLVVRVNADPGEEEGEHHLGLAIVNPQGERSVIADRHPFRFARVIDVDSPLTALVIITMVITFRSAGQYVFEILEDDHPLKRIPLQLRLHEQPPQNAANNV